MKGKVGLHGHEPSVGISSFSTEFFRKGSFDVHHIVIVFIIREGIYLDGGRGHQEAKSWGNSVVMEQQVVLVTINTFYSIDLALFLECILSYCEM